MQRVRFDGFGGNDVVRLESLEDPRPGDEQVLIAAPYAGVNPLDVLQRNGQYPVPHGASPELPGVEVGGTIVAIGGRVTRWRPGDRVMGLVTEGGLASRVLAHQDHLLAVPDDVSDLAAATLPEAVITAFDALWRGRTRTKDVVLVRGVNGGVGIASYRIAESMGAMTFGIVRSSNTKQILRTYGITACLEDECSDALVEFGGASVIVDLVGGEYIDDDLRLLAPGGRIVAVSIAAGAHAKVPLDLLMSKRADLMGTVLRPRSISEKAKLIMEVERSVGPLIRSGALTLPVEQVFPAGRVADAFDHLQLPGKVGKVVLEFSAG
ncbi:zinc-binding dehydrogenase [Ornithinimicrobium murale]|uniref:zinc-binding dehydrogenase n=1 Tax=Ornithinimicrobium murale TaxID=1050153 RepID=UPI000E0D0017|nr:zinc-binding dehydrogenase [Ornithinimicrobium murale]